jgi:RNA polymerase sigma factor (sigma-70 family)
VAEQRPAATAFAFDIVAEELQRKAFMDLYYFGVQSPQDRHMRRLEAIEAPEAEAEKERLFFATYDHDPERYKELAAQGFFDLPKEKEALLRKGPSLTFDEELGSTLAAMQYNTYRIARVAMSIAGEESRVAGVGYYGLPVCEAFLEVSEQFPIIFAGVMQEKWGGHPRTRHWAAASLTGWVRSRISLSINPRLKAALEGIGGSSASEQILQELAGAVVTEWATLERGEPLSVLVTRAALRLEKEGDQASRLDREGKLAEGEPDKQSGVHEQDLDEFMLREELRALKEAAKLSELEHQVLQLALEEDRSNNSIAEHLNLTVNSVKTLKKRARKKLRQAAGQ